MDKHPDVLELSIEPEDEGKEEQPSFLKKIGLFAVGILLILFIISFVFVSYPIGDILRGQAESTLLQDHHLRAGDITIFFSEDTAQHLEQLYLQEQKAEFSFCLSGEKEGETYSISSLYQPRIFAQAFNHVSFEPCSPDTLIMLHSHPYKSCLASETDLETLRKTQERNPDILMVVMCESKRFSVYR